MEIHNNKTGEKLFEAVQMSTNANWKLKLSGCIDPRDAHAYDIAYHKDCYSKNVLNPLRSRDLPTLENHDVGQSASITDFINSLADALMDGKVVTMAEAEEKYNDICDLNGVEKNNRMNRKSLKASILDELWEHDLEFSNLNRKNEPQRISIKAVRDVVLTKAEDNLRLNGDMKVLFQSAKILRKCILSAPKWEFEGHVAFDKNSSIIPKELMYFIRWCIGGCTDFANVKNSNISEELQKKASVLSQNLMYECLSDRQMKRVTTSSTQHTRILPLQVGVGLTIQSKTRSKFLVQLMHSLGSSIEYSKVLRLETSIGNEAMSRMEANDGLYVPHDLVQGRFIFCAADNIDFLEDTPNGKGTLHGTIMTCYQEKTDSDQIQSFIISTPTTDRSMKRLPKNMTEMYESNTKKKIKPTSTRFHISNVPKYDKQIYVKLDNIWLLSKCWKFSKKLSAQSMTSSCSETGNNISNDIPTWSAFNAELISQCGKFVQEISKSEIDEELQDIAPPVSMASVDNDSDTSRPNTSSIPAWFTLQCFF